MTKPVPIRRPKVGVTSLYRPPLDGYLLPRLDPDRHKPRHDTYAVGFQHPEPDDRYWHETEAKIGFLAGRAKL